METTRHLHIVHLLIRNRRDEDVCFLVYPHEKWKDEDGRPYWTLPAKKTVSDPFAAFIRGSSLEHFLEALLEQERKLTADEYALEQELPPVRIDLEKSPGHSFPTSYTIYPLDIWIDPASREKLRQNVEGQWLTCTEALAEARLSPTAKAVFEALCTREDKLTANYAKDPKAEQQAEAERRLLNGVPDRPTMEALARKWLHCNRGGVRHLPAATLDAILDSGTRAFNLRVADPYLRYQMQGVGFTWSFFTHKDPQDLHVHGAPMVEIYGVLEGELEVWWKPYHDRGTSAWCHCVLKTGDWLEVDALQCHLVHWRGAGKGVVFKAGPGPLAEVGKLGVKGKTRCEENCPCMKPEEVARLARPR